ncbi:hypothetical protein GQX74_010634 [Glossina fuscipes]|nr:hypothetical protein GQX74_010634 [Glossina fuscipes]
MKANKKGQLALQRISERLSATTKNMKTKKEETKNTNIEKKKSTIRIYSRSVIEWCLEVFKTVWRHVDYEYYLIDRFDGFRFVGLLSGTGGWWLVAGGWWLVANSAAAISCDVNVWVLQGLRPVLRNKSYGSSIVASAFVQVPKEFKCIKIEFGEILRN